MMNNFDEIQKMSKDSMDMAMESFGSMSKGFQAIAAEVADYQRNPSKKALLLLRNW